MPIPINSYEQEIWGLSFLYPEVGEGEMKHSEWCRYQVDRMHREVDRYGHQKDWYAHQFVNELRKSLENQYGEREDKSK